MTKDERLYAKLTLDFAEHEKIFPLSDAAFRCLVEAILWSRKRMTDGWLARRLAVAKWSLDVLEELSTNDPENPSLIESESGWQIRDFASQQDTKADIEARRERNRVAGQKGGLARGKRSAKRPASEVLSETQAETETETYNPTGLPVGGARKRATRIPENWLPSEESISAVKTECPTVALQAEHVKFVDYWTAKAGKDATKLDWDATWRNWIRRAAENPRNGNNNHGPKVPASDAAVAAVEALMNSTDFRLELE